MRRRAVLPKLSLDTLLEERPSHRQTFLSLFDNCRLAALFALEGSPYTNGAMARGSLFHRYAAEVLRTLAGTGEVQIPVAEALVILREVCAQRDIPDDEVVLPPAPERRLLRMCAIKFANENKFSTDRIMSIEQRLDMTLRYPHPDGGVVERVVTGQPDAIVADPPTPADPTIGVIVPDWKTSRKAPAQGPPDDHWDDPDHISYLGYFQQRLYGLLVFHNFPSVQRVKLREFYVLDRQARFATLYRNDVEQLEEEFSMLVELLDRALMGGSKSKIWAPSPGLHCAFCPAPQRCPIEADVRAREGGIATAPEAKQAAAEYVLAKRVGKVLHEALKNWVENYGPVPVKSAKGRAEVRFRRNKTGSGQTFGVYVPEASDRGPLDPDLESTFKEITERRRAAA